MYRLNFKSQFLILLITVSTIVEIIASTHLSVRTTAFASLLVTEVIGQREAHGAAMPTVLAELPETFTPGGITPRTAIQYVSYVER